MKTLDIKALEWFDKVNGNSYFSALVTVDYGMDTESTIKLPFQYGYGDHYIDMADKALVKAGFIPETSYHLTNWCRENKVILRYHIMHNCKQREVKNLVS